MSSSSCVAHVALLPSAGMGHLTPFLRLAAMLCHHHCHVTLITPKPTVSNAESKLLSKFFSAFPQVNQLNLHLLPSSSHTANADPFFLQFDAIRRSCHLLHPLLSSLSPPLSSFVYDMTLISPVLPIATAIGVPHYILFTSSASMFCFFSCFPNAAESISDRDGFDIPGFSYVSKSWIPPQLLDINAIFRKLFLEDSPKVTKLHGVFLNTFEEVESKTLEALNAGELVKDLPPVHALGPFVPCYEFEGLCKTGEPLKWLDEQPDGSVLYVCFGSRTALESNQIREIGDGLLRSGFRFLWVMKGNKVDKEDEEKRLEGVLGIELVEKIIKENKGMVVKEWVDQRQILDHSAVGGFFSHCGWNSVMEAAFYGVPILGWPLAGDQKINAEFVVSNGGFGIWKKDWGWEGERLVRGEEIGDAIKEFMSDESFFAKAEQVKMAARKAVSVRGSSKINLHKLIEEWKKS
ncbi:UDP-glycosyltransferase 708G1-like [Arachis stenosperma]|uniref:UDP-glycosyltransferase 708G1-like n=1 Tax=Arachis stenosperma TaxID=217475 RepID=UPI0025AC72A1|nr:UDP-glycosyltransferase 708G1-like [Arachis stenosperma]